MNTRNYILEISRYLKKGIPKTPYGKLKQLKWKAGKMRAGAISQMTKTPPEKRKILNQIAGETLKGGKELKQRMLQSI